MAVEIIKCKNCGADFDIHKASCPFCGELNYQGAEEEYMGHLYGINQEMSEMRDDSEEEFKSGIKKSTKIILIIVAILATFVAIVVVSLIGMKVMLEKKYAKMSEDKFVWKQTYMSQLDDMYEKGQYDELADFLEEHYKDAGYYPYEWEHMNFCLVHKQFMHYKEDIQGFDTMDKTSMYWALYEAIDIMNTGKYSGLTYTDAEWEIIHEYQEEIQKELFEEKLGLDTQGMEQLFEEVEFHDSTHNPDSEKCKKYIEKKFGL